LTGGENKGLGQGGWKKKERAKKKMAMKGDRKDTKKKLESREKKDSKEGGKSL